MSVSGQLSLGQRPTAGMDYNDIQSQKILGEANYSDLTIRPMGPPKWWWFSK